MRLLSIVTGIFLMLFWTLGLFDFIRGLPEPNLAAPMSGDGVVVYTGGGGARITAGMEIFSGGAGNRLLISGVNPETSRKRLSEMWEGAQVLFDCCVDLGREALSTEGNAAEVRAWAQMRNYKNVILVTSEYHMPRAITLTRAHMPDVVITPYAVASGYLNENRQPVSLAAWRKLAGEYSKFLLARVKAFFSFSGR